jgi:hypothetical protein
LIRPSVEEPVNIRNHSAGYTRAGHKRSPEGIMRLDTIAALLHFLVDRFNECACDISLLLFCFKNVLSWDVCRGTRRRYGEATMTARVGRALARSKTRLHGGIKAHTTSHPTLRTARLFFSSIDPLSTQRLAMASNVNVIRIDTPHGPHASPQPTTVVYPRPTDLP